MASALNAGLAQRQEQISESFDGWKTEILRVATTPMAAAELKGQVELDAFKKLPGKTMEKGKEKFQKIALFLKARDFQLK